MGHRQRVTLMLKQKEKAATEQADNKYQHDMERWK
jgi:hypothetical protein